MTSGEFTACKLAYKSQSLETSSNPIPYVASNELLVLGVY